MKIIIILLFIVSGLNAQDTALIYAAKQKEKLIKVDNLLKLLTISRDKKIAMRKEIAQYIAPDSLNIYINTDYIGSKKDGSILYPFRSISEAPIREGGNYRIVGIDTISNILIDKSCAIEGGKLVISGRIKVTGKAVRFGGVTFEGNPTVQGLLSFVGTDSSMVVNCRFSNAVNAINITSSNKLAVWYSEFSNGINCINVIGLNNLDLVDNKRENFHTLIKFNDLKFVAFQNDLNSVSYELRK